MLILLDYGWPWIILGMLLILWGASILKLSLSEWLSFILSLLWLPFTDDTKQEKEQVAQPVEDAVDSSPGCFILLAGLLMIIVGVAKLLA